MEKTLGRYFQVRSAYYQAAQCNQETPIPVKVTGQVWVSQKKDKVNTNHSYYQLLSL